MINHKAVAVEGMGYGHLSIATQGWLTSLEDLLNFFFEFGKVTTSHTFYIFYTFFSYVFSKFKVYSFNENEFYNQQVEFEVEDNESL